MKVSVFSYYPADKVEAAIKKHGFELEKKKPDLIIAFGGDGTILTAEKEYPGIPKVAIKRSGICERCFEYRLKDIHSILEELKNREFETLSYSKVEAHLKGRKVIGLNEVQIQNKDPRKALRLRVETGDRKMDNIIGDGIVAATAFGSTAYYRAIGYKPFDKGVRIGFNNTYPRLDAIVLAPTDSARVEVLRETGYLAADNSELIEMGPGDVASIKESEKTAKFINMKPK